MYKLKIYDMGGSKIRYIWLIVAFSFFFVSCAGGVKSSNGVNFSAEYSPVKYNPSTNHWESGNFISTGEEEGLDESDGEEEGLDESLLYLIKPRHHVVYETTKQNVVYETTKQNNGPTFWDSIGALLQATFIGLDMYNSYQYGQTLKAQRKFLDRH